MFALACKELRPHGRTSLVPSDQREAWLLSNVLQEYMDDPNQACQFLCRRNATKNKQPSGSGQ